MSNEAQINFAAGELSPLLYYRSDIDARRAGVKELLNMVALPHGPAKARLGFEYMGQIADSYARMFTFEFVDVSFAIIIGIDNIYIIDNDGSIVETIAAPGFSQLAIEEMQSAMQPRNAENDTFLLHLVSRWSTPHHILFDGVNFTLVETIFQGEDWTSAPGTIEFHDGRLYLAGSSNEPVTVWASVPHDYFNFTLGVGDAADDALIFPLAKAGIIRWLVSNDKLFVGLSTGEQVIFAQGGPIAPDNANTDQQSKFGSKRVQAIMLENLVTYVNTDGSVVRAMTYSDVNEKYNSEELSFQAEHITKSGINEIKYAENSPNAKSVSQLFCLLSSGTMVTMSINTGQGTVGWSEHDLSDEVKSNTIVNEDGVDVQWILVERNGVLYYEKYSEEYLDSHISIDLGTPNNVVTGLDHLIGREVRIIADGKMHPIRIVENDGSLVLDYDATNVVVGLGYNSKMVTLPQINDVESGNTLPFFKRFSDMFVAIIESARPIINGQDTFLRQPATTMGERELFTTEIVEISEDGWDINSEITIEQPLPLPLTIAAVGGKLKENKV